MTYTIYNESDAPRAIRKLRNCTNPVTLVRCEDPFEVLDRLQQYCADQNLAFKHYDYARGITVYTEDVQQKAQTFDKITDGVMADLYRPTSFPLAPNIFFSSIGSANGIPPNAIPNHGLDAKKNTDLYNALFSKWSEKGIYAFVYPESMIGMKDQKKSESIITNLKLYAKTLVETEICVVLIATPDAKLCPELESDVKIIDIVRPDSDYLHLTTQTILVSLDYIESEDDYDKEVWEPVIRCGAGLSTKQYTSSLVSALLTVTAREEEETDIEEIASLVNKDKVSEIKKSEILEVMEPKKASEVGGMDLLKEWIAERKFCFTPEAKAYGVDRPRGVLLAGPSGTGKSLAGAAIAETLGLPLLKLDIGRVYNSLVGQSESNIRNALSLVEAMAPCVLFIDEIDKSFSRTNGTMDGGVSMRVMGTLLTWLQENTKDVFCVMSANRVGNMPSELLRKGRLDEIFSVTVPTAEEAKEIFQIHLRKRNQNTDGIDFERVADNASLFVPAEIESVVKDAVLESFSKKVQISTELLIKHCDLVKPLCKVFEEDFNAMKDWAEKNARPSSSLKFADNTGHGGTVNIKALSRRNRPQKIAITEG